MIPPLLTRDLPFDTLQVGDEFLYDGRIRKAVRIVRKEGRITLIHLGPINPWDRTSVVKRSKLHSSYGKTERTYKRR